MDSDNLGGSQLSSSIMFNQLHPDSNKLNNQENEIDIRASDNNDDNLISDNKINENHKMSQTEEAIFTGIQRLPITLSMTSEDRLNE